MKIEKSLYFFICLFIVSACHHANEKKESSADQSVYQLSAEEKIQLKEGDIILRHGYGFVSNSIVKALREDLPVSHVGVIVKNGQEKFSVIHSVSQTLSDYNGVQIQDLQSFVRDSQDSSIVIVRYKNAIENEGSDQQIAKHAYRYLKKRVPFDYRFDLEDSTGFYCSELIVRIFSDTYNFNAEKQIFLNAQKPEDKLRLDVFRNPGLFVEIINHHHPKKSGL
ncbi:MAG: YiiX/YebB-like N1pC/P60 family cysteine hydrolase [Bacteroidota bacterium]